MGNRNDIEKISFKDNKLNKLRVFFLALIGYGYIFLTLLCLISLVILSAYIIVENRAGALLKLLVPVLILIYVIGKSLWVRIPEPLGIQIEEYQAQELFRLINEVRAETKAGRIYRVLLTDEYNASVAQIPLLGIFGVYRNYLIIGIPLMMALSREEFKGVLAHEFGHISKSHGKFGNWVYRIRETWFRLRDEIEEGEGRGAFIFKWFFNWYIPVFSRYTFNLARLEEFEADKFSRDSVGIGTAGDALISIAVKGIYLDEEFWPMIYDKASHIVSPPENLYFEMEDFLVNKMNQGDTQKFYKRVLEYKSSEYDTHPAIEERLSAIGYNSEYTNKIYINSARELLEDSFEELCNIFSTMWRENNRESWKERYSFVVDGSKRLIELGNIIKERELTIEEQWEICYTTEAVYGDKKAMPLYLDFLEKHPNFFPANYAAGRLLLKDNNPEGIKLIEKAMDGDSEYIMEGTKLIHDYYFFKGEVEEAGKYYMKALEFSEILDMSHKERNLLEFNAEYLPHQLDADEIKELVIQLSSYSEIKEAYLVRKKVEHFPEKPLYALGIVLNYPWYSLKSKYKKFVEKIADEVVFNGETLVAYLNEDNSRLKKIMRNIPGSKIYPQK